MSSDNLRSILESIYEERGNLTPALVVAEATPIEHPLHTRFEWDDKVAGHEHRVSQARKLIQSVRVQVLPSKMSEPMTIRGFVSVPSPSSSSVVPRFTYMPVDDAMHDDFIAQQLLQDFENKVRELKRQFDHLAEFRAIIKRELLGE